MSQLFYIHDIEEEASDLLYDFTIDACYWLEIDCGGVSQYINIYFNLITSRTKEWTSLIYSFHY